LVVGGQGLLKMLLESLAPGSAELHLEVVLPRELLCEFLLSPRSVHQCVDVVDLVDERRLLGDGQTLRSADGLVTVPLGLSGMLALLVEVQILRIR
jgi:hypothetical protein